MSLYSLNLNPDIFISYIGEEIESFQNALKFYKEALKYEWKLGPGRRSWEYNDLKEDFRKLLKLMHEDSQPYEKLFHVSSVILFYGGYVIMK